MSGTAPGQPGRMPGRRLVGRPPGNRGGRTRDAPRLGPEGLVGQFVEVLAEGAWISGLVTGFYRKEKLHQVDFLQAVPGLDDPGRSAVGEFVSATVFDVDSQNYTWRRPQHRLANSQDVRMHTNAKVLEQARDSPLSGKALKANWGADGIFVGTVIGHKKVDTVLPDGALKTQLTWKVQYADGDDEWGEFNEERTLFTLEDGVKRQISWFEGDRAAHQQSRPGQPPRGRPRLNSEGQKLQPNKPNRPRPGGSQSAQVTGAFGQSLNKTLMKAQRSKALTGQQGSTAHPRNPQPPHPPGSARQSQGNRATLVIDDDDDEEEDDEQAAGDRKPSKGQKQAEGLNQKEKTPANKPDGQDQRGRKRSHGGRPIGSGPSIDTRKKGLLVSDDDDDDDVDGGLPLKKRPSIRASDVVDGKGGPLLHAFDAPKGHPPANPKASLQDEQQTSRKRGRLRKGSESSEPLSSKRGRGRLSHPVGPRRPSNDEDDPDYAEPVSAGRGRSSRGRGRGRSAAGSGGRVIRRVAKNQPPPGATSETPGPPTRPARKSNEQSQTKIPSEHSTPMHLPGMDDDGNDEAPVTSTRPVDQPKTDNGNAAGAAQSKQTDDAPPRKLSSSRSEPRPAATGPPKVESAKPKAQEEAKVNAPSVGVKSGATGFAGGLAHTVPRSSSLPRSVSSSLSGRPSTAMEEFQARMRNRATTCDTTVTKTVVGGMSDSDISRQLAINEFEQNLDAMLGMNRISGRKIAELTTTAIEGAMHGAARKIVQAMLETMDREQCMRKRIGVLFVFDSIMRSPNLVKKTEALEVYTNLISAAMNSIIENLSAEVEGYVELNKVMACWESSGRFSEGVMKMSRERMEVVKKRFGASSDEVDLRCQGFNVVHLPYDGPKCVAVALLSEFASAGDRESFKNVIGLDTLKLKSRSQKTPWSEAETGIANHARKAGLPNPRKRVQHQGPLRPDEQPRAPPPVPPPHRPAETSRPPPYSANPPPARTGTGRRHQSRYSMGASQGPPPGSSNYAHHQRQQPVASARQPSPDPFEQCGTVRVQIPDGQMQPGQAYAHAQGYGRSATNSEFRAWCQQKDDQDFTRTVETAGASQQFNQSTGTQNQEVASDDMEVEAIPPKASTVNTTIEQTQPPPQPSTEPPPLPPGPHPDDLWPPLPKTPVPDDGFPDEAPLPPEPYPGSPLPKTPPPQPTEEEVRRAQSGYPTGADSSGWSASAAGGYSSGMAAPQQQQQQYQQQYGHHVQQQQQQHYRAQYGSQTHGGTGSGAGSGYSNTSGYPVMPTYSHMPPHLARPTAPSGNPNQMGYGSSRYSMNNQPPAYPYSGRGPRQY